MNARDSLLGYFRLDGYHNDSSAFTRRLIENRVSRQAADKAWREGAAQKRAGMRCSCLDCNKGVR